MGNEKESKFGDGWGTAVIIMSPEYAMILILGTHWSDGPAGTVAKSRSEELSVDIGGIFYFLFFVFFNENTF